MELRLLNKKEIKATGWDWLLNYDYELKDVLKAQRDLTRKQILGVLLKCIGYCEQNDRLACLVHLNNLIQSLKEGIK